MYQNKRIAIVVVILVAVVAGVLGVDSFQRLMAASQAPIRMPPGSIPIFMDGKFLVSFVPEDLDQLAGASFVDEEEGKSQEGWLLRDVLLLYLSEQDLQAMAQITVYSSSRKKSRTLTWDEIRDRDNMVLFDLSGRGTLKLVSKIPGFDIREDWIQDVDMIKISNP